MEVRRVESLADVSAVSQVQPVSPQQREEQSRLIHAVESVNEAQLFGEGNELRFVIDRRTKRPVMRIVNKETQEVVRQIPAESVLRMAAEIRL
ncbi:MAG: flagellar protein FlaG [Acidobacteria bacterium]|nr:flagellar protein FlaG [Acidobacteriota bacterium]